MDEYDEQTEEFGLGPEPDDYTMTPTGLLGSKTGVSCCGAWCEFDTTEEALAFIRQDMEAERFWPAVWWVSDHGNSWLVDVVTGAEISEDSYEAI